MADSRFFAKPAPVTLQDIVALTGAQLVAAAGQASDDASRRFDDVAPLERAGAGDISFLENTRYLPAFEQSRAGACFVKPQFVQRAPQGMLLLVTPEPYFAYALTAARFYPEEPHTPAISPRASIAASAQIGKDVRIDDGAVIGDNTTIGDGCHIGANSVIGRSVAIGDHCRIGALCSLSHCVIGHHTVLHRGIHIGQDGFGFAPGSKGIVKVPQLGRVIIGNHVEIGSGTCIDRGAGPDTVIGDHCKIDNLVQIGHNVQLGKYVIIASQCGIAGSTRIDDGAMLGGQVGISGHVQIGRGAKLAAQSGIMTDIPPGGTYGGSPAIPIKDWHRQTATVARWSKKRASSGDLS